MAGDTERLNQTNVKGFPMRRDGYSKFRILLFVVLLCTILFSASGSFAQDAAVAADAAAKEPNMIGTLMRLIVRNMDPVFFVILLCSVTAVTLIVKGFMQARRSVMIPPASTERIRELITARQFRELEEFTASDPSMVSKALYPALKRAPSFSAMKEAMETALGEETAEQFRKIEYLNIIGNLGPLLGLLGTVLGMIAAFAAVERAGGSAKVGELSGGISAALTHTFLGLAVAIPCLASFGVLRTMVDRLTVAGAMEAEELLLMIKPSEAKPAAAGTPAAQIAAARKPASAATQTGVGMPAQT